MEVIIHYINYKGAKSVYPVDSNDESLGEDLEGFLSQCPNSVYSLSTYEFPSGETFRIRITDTYSLLEAILEITRDSLRHADCVNHIKRHVTKYGRIARSC